MSYERNRLRAFGLCLIAVLGMAALMAGGAQGQWLVNGQTLSGHESINAEFHEKGALIRVPTLAGGFEVVCHKVSFTEGLLLGTSLTTPPSQPNIAHVTFHSTECLTFTEGVHRPACDVALIMSKTLILPILHNGVTKLLFEPPPGEEAFKTINMPISCPLPLKNKVTGSYVVECLKEADLALLDCLHAQTNQLFRQVPHALGLALGDTLKYGNHAASMSSVLKVFLTGPNAGQPWAIHAP